MKRKYKRKFEFSKIIVICLGIVVGIVTTFTLLVVYDTKDTSPLAYLIPAVYTALATGTGFYYNKAKFENQIKLRKQYGSQVYKDVKGETYYDNEENYG